MVNPAGTALRPGPRVPRGWSARVAPLYSDTLKDLITHCVEYLPADRPDLLNLGLRVRLGVNTFNQGLRNANANGKHLLSCLS